MRYSTAIAWAAFTFTVGQLPWALIDKIGFGVLTSVVILGAAVIQADKEVS